MATLIRCTARMIIDRFYIILHQRTVPDAHIDRSPKEITLPDFAEDDVNDLLKLLLILPDNALFPAHDNSLIIKPNFDIPSDLDVDVAVDSFYTHPPG
jgi:hypothetical protein